MAQCCRAVCETVDQRLKFRGYKISLDSWPIFLVVCWVNAMTSIIALYISLVVRQVKRFNPILKIVRKETDPTKELNFNTPLISSVVSSRVPTT